MKTSLIIAALAAALITGSTATSQAIPAAPLGKSLQHNNSSLVENVLIRRGYRGFGVYRGYRHVGIHRGYRRVGLYRGYRRFGYYGYRSYRPLAFYGYRGYRHYGYRGYRWGGVALYRHRRCGRGWW
jgi:hypothetical protein